MADTDLFRWQALFHRSREPLFLLNRRRRFLFVNHAWEELTGVTAQSAVRQPCKRYRDAVPGSPEAVFGVLSPPPEVLEGKLAHVRRLMPRSGGARGWWDLDFFPLQGDKGLLAILGKITALGVAAPEPVAPLPEKLGALRETLTQRYRVDHLASDLPIVQRVADQVRLASQNRASVLIVGPSGSGKHWLARAIHHHGITREQTFAVLDAAGLPAPALSSILFGAGGLLHSSSLGTLYIREPAALPREVQAELSGWLAELGQGRARMIAGCSRDPAEEVRAGRLLEQLHCALGTITIELPSLSERLPDLPVLLDRLLERANGDGPRRISGLTPEARELLQGYDWPGNLSELYAVLVSAREHAQGERIDAPDLPAYLRQTVHLDQAAGGRNPPRPLPLERLLDQVQHRLIVLALRMTKGQQSKAARLLDIPRQGLISRMKRLGIKYE